MRISIWQQFSSNHSASFEIVGKFQTEREAQAAADELRQILERMVKWWQENDAADWEHNLKRNKLTPIEQQIRDEYGIEGFQESLIWDHKQHKLPIEVAGRFLFITDWHGWEATTGPRPFTDLLQVLGGQVTFEGGGTHANIHGSMSIELTFTAPDEQTGQAIEDILHTHIPLKPDQIPPWVAFHRGKRNPRAAELLTEERLANATSYFDNDPFYENYQSAVEEGNTELLEETKELYAATAHSRLSFEDFIWAHEAFFKTAFVFDDGIRGRPIHFGRTGLKWRISNLIGTANDAASVAAITAWMEDQGCTDVDFIFIQDSISENK